MADKVKADLFEKMADEVRSQLKAELRDEMASEVLIGLEEEARSKIEVEMSTQMEQLKIEKDNLDQEKMNLQTDMDNFKKESEKVKIEQQKTELAASFEISNPDSTAQFEEKISQLQAEAANFKEIIQELEEELESERNKVIGRCAWYPVLLVAKLLHKVIQTLLIVYSHHKSRKGKDKEFGNRWKGPSREVWLRKGWINCQSSAVGQRNGGIAERAGAIEQWKRPKYQGIAPWNDFFADWSWFTGESLPNTSLSDDSRNLSHDKFWQLIQMKTYNKSTTTWKRTKTTSWSCYLTNK